MKYEVRRITISEYQYLRHAVGWWETDNSATKEALDNSLCSVVAVSGKKIAGIGRVVGDNGLYYYIQDLIVHPDHQSKGIGREIMRMLLSYISGRAGKGAFIGLMAARGLEGYYKEFGFEPRPNDGPGMYFIKQ
jgi:ribosomal protein S18 acetylase RimI-like enzyme